MSNYVFIHGVLINLDCFGSIQSGAYLSKDKWFLRFRNKEHTQVVYQFDYHSIDEMLTVLTALSKLKGIYDKNEFTNLKNHFETEHKNTIRDSESKP